MSTLFEHVSKHLLRHQTVMVAAVYHVTADGWKKVRGDDVGELHYEYYPAPEAHPCFGTDPLEAA